MSQEPDDGARIVEQVNLLNQIKGGGSWLYAIALFSAVNTILFLAEFDMTFIVGLGITQFIDVLGYIFREELPQISLMISLVVAAINMVIVVFFTVLGYWARKQKMWPFVTGMIVYGLDSLIMLFFEDFWGFGFHVFAIIGIYRGYSALKTLRGYPADSRIDDQELELLNSLPNIPQANTPEMKRKKLLRFAMVVSIPFALLIIFMLLMIWAN